MLLYLGYAIDRHDTSIIHDKLNEHQQVPELRVSRIEGSNLILGAARTLNDLRDALGAVQSKSKSFEASCESHRKDREQSRSKSSFDCGKSCHGKRERISDLESQGAGATLSVLDNATKSMSVETFLSGSSEFQSGDLIVDVRIQAVMSCFEPTDPRYRRNCHAILNSAMMIETMYDGKIKILVSKRCDGT